MAIGQEYRTKVVELVINEDEQDRRIDNFLISILPNIPKTTFYKLLRKGEIRVNKGRIKPEYKLKLNDVVRMPPLVLTHTLDKTAELKDIVKLNSVQDLKNRIVYEDEGLFIINKPAGIAVHGGSGVNYGVVEALRVLFPREKRLELVHRIDRETSGLLMVARKPSVLKFLQDQFRNKTIFKSYLCLVPGIWQESQVDAPLLRYEKLGERFVKVDDQGKESQTKFKRLAVYQDENGEKYSLVEASPLTGRTHQIRVHALHALAPLAGDEKYQDLIATSYIKKVGLKRMFLHAYKLNFISAKTGEREVIEISLDNELENFLSKLTKIE
ncbi:RluA family pseudouridine synthase [Psittacicella hinzii]|uniref:RluA family pseudouridine synthase n=1 Tax=Psittacicella hinzii TaxID=2028575 RepID=UPI0021D5E2AE|nr:RluA family pseudouridine synthase [Psittacicella hinzii]